MAPQVSGDPAAITVVDKIRFLKRIAADRRLNATDLRCCIIIADLYNAGKGRAWPSYERIAKDTGTSRASVARAVRKLDELALIQRSGGYKGRSNSYVPAFRIEEQEDRAARESSDIDASDAIAPSHKRDLNSLTDETTSVSAIRLNPSTTPRSNQRRGGGGIPSGPPALRAPAGGAPPLVNKKPTGQQRAATSPDGFEAFWQEYPKKEGRNNAIRAYRSAIVQGVNPVLLAEKAEQYAVAKAVVDPRYLKMPASWLQDQCWLEDPQPPRPKVPRATARRKGAGVMAGKGKTPAPPPKPATRKSKRKATSGRKRGPYKRYRFEPAPVPPPTIAKPVPMTPMLPTINKPTPVPPTIARPAPVALMPAPAQPLDGYRDALGMLD
jgi:Helix-turn-helix domain